MKQYKVTVVFGTRPEAIKMCPLVLRLQADPRFATRVVVTAQHRAMLDSVLECFGVRPDIDLDLMTAGQSIAQVASGVLRGVTEVLAADRPDLVLVHGDTSTALGAAQAAFYLQIPVCHVEAGLRSGDIHSPFPEEFNRRGISLIAALHLAPTRLNVANLEREGVPPAAITRTGNTVIDALNMVIAADYQFSDPELAKLDPSRRMILMTCHRRENLGEPMRAIFSAMARIVADLPDVELVFPVHPNPKVRALADEVLAGRPRIHLIEPLDYVPFANLMQRCHLVLTDSGGIQEEAPALGKPVVVLRTETERPEAVESGTVVMAGVDGDRIYEITHRLLTDDAAYQQMAKAVNPYGDGTACTKSVEAIGAYLSSR
ncbi:MAG: UDP-N-acetylglucosamine 2-epimerase (non-hydrolyzing) [Proteobacteria bacterium]|nr:UDP-N-acetylglucosamine 2-epimerase (non-hydrolyzing) [Pseudomonadota bacterium]